MNVPNSSLAQDLDNYLQEAAENNPELKARFNEYLAAMEKVPQAGALPDPELTFGFFTRPMETLMGNQQGELSLMQMFPWFGMLRSQKNEAAIMARGRYEAFREAKNQLYYQIKETWYQLHQINEERKIAEENLEILRSIERMALIRFQSGDGGATSSDAMTGSSMPSSGNRQQRSTSGNAGGGMGGMGGGASPATSRGSSANSNSGAGNMASSGSGMADVLRVQIEIMELENDLQTLNDAKIPLSIKLNTLLNRNEDIDIVLPDTLYPRNLTSGTIVLNDSILDQYPMSRMLEAEKEAFQAQQQMGKLQGRPMFGAGVNYMIFQPMNEGGMGMVGGRNMIMPMIRLSLPIFRKKYNAIIKEAELNQEAVTFQKVTFQNDLKVQWHEAIKDLRDIERKIILFQEQSQLAAQALEIMIASYAANGSSFEDILRVQQQLLNYKLNLVNAVVSQNTTIAMLERITVSDLDN